MKSIRNKNRLIFSEFTRVILSFLILYLNNLPLFVKIILIISLEYLDCAPKFGGFGPLLSKNTDICHTTYYQEIDKVADITCYLLILIYIFQYNTISKNWLYFIFVLFFIRLIGSYLFILTKRRCYLFYFPNFFLEVTIVLSLVKYFSLNNYCNITLIILIFIYKLIQEYYLHIYKPEILKNNL